VQSVGIDLDTASSLLTRSRKEEGKDEKDYLYYCGSSADCFGGVRSEKSCGDYA
jgi:hypothetical protein